MHPNPPPTPEGGALAAALLPALRSLFSRAAHEVMPAAAAHDAAVAAEFAKLDALRQRLVRGRERAAGELRAARAGVADLQSAIEGLEKV